MTHRPDLDPRSYSPGVRMARRLANGPSVAPARTTLAETLDWLVGPDALASPDLTELMEALAWRIRASGAPVSRMTAHLGTLHPQLAGMTWRWLLSDGAIEEARVPRASLALTAYTESPLVATIHQGATVHVRMDRPEEVARFPLMADLKARGLTEYVCRPIGGGGGAYNAATFATDRPGGFTADQLAALHRIYDLFGLHTERHIARTIAANVLDTYLGVSAGRKVLAGSIARGEGERIRAVIWVSDLRGFSERADRMAAEDVTALLNLYFEAMAGAVMAEGGEVLKFIGDGLLAVFPVGDDPAAAARSALAAAERANAAVARLNAGGDPALAEAPLRSGIALHLGDAFYGNVGAPDRLDFTVIGKAVNEAARVEALTKTLGRDLLVTAPVAALLGGGLEDLGAHALRGVSAPTRLFAPAGA